MEVLHFKFLRSSAANISSQALNALVHLRYNSFVLVIVIIVFGDDLVKVVLLNINFHGKLLNFLLKSQIVILFLIIYFLGVSYYFLELGSFIEELVTLTLHLLRLSIKSVYDGFLFLLQFISDEVLLGKHLIMSGCNCISVFNL
jgi:hypothetical protein